MNLAERFKNQPADRAALVVHGRATSYGTLIERVNRWRGGLLAAGLEPGDRVAVVAGNNEVFVVSYLAILSAGLIAVPLNPQCPAPELKRQLEQVTPRAIIVGETGRQAWTALQGQDLGELAHHFVADGSVVPDLDEASPAPVVSVPDDHPAVLLFTSGTSGPSKPAVLTHGNFWASLQSLSQMSDVDLSKHHLVLAVIPLFHIFGLNVIINLGLMVGATLVLEDHVAPRRTAELIRSHRITMMLGPPNMWAAFVRDSALDRSDFETVEIAVSGAAKLEPKVWLDLNDRLDLDIREGYGLTETCATVASATGVNSPPGSVGEPMPGVELRLVDTDGRDVLVGDPGEVHVRGPMVSPGYWEDGTIVSHSRTPDGWLRTGDLAVVDEMGHLSVIDRLKDLIIVSGFNVHPAEVEQVMSEADGVEAVGVVGEPSDELGEQVVAYVVLEPGVVPDLVGLRDHAAAQLARYKVPRRIEIVDALPTGLVGKLVRRDLGL